MLRDPSLIPLSSEHHDGLAMCVLTRRALANDASAGNIERLAQKVALRFEVQLANHFQVEEEVLFPVCGPLPLVKELMAEHQELLALVDRLRAAPSAYLLEQICERLTTHIRREERELFEHIQRVIPREILDRTGKEIDRRSRKVCL